MTLRSQRQSNGILPADKRQSNGITRRRVRLLHTSDLHLPGERSAFSSHGLAAVGDAFHALARVVDAANARKVDVVLFTGDLFDTYQPSPQVISFVLDQMERLNPPAVLIPGNHDCLDCSRVYLGSEWKRTLKPYAITDPLEERLEVPDLPLTLWGKAMTDHTPAFQPLAGLPERTPAHWCVALGHGFLYPEGRPDGRSSPIRADEIRASGWDYIALGHKHVFQDVSEEKVRAAYAGSPVRVWNERAQCLLVTLDDEQEEKVAIEVLSTTGILSGSGPARHG